jgi:hypothetical protein
MSAGQLLAKFADTEFVAIEITKVSPVKLGAASARCALVLRSKSDGFGIGCIDTLRGFAANGNHHAVADGGGLLVC